MNKTSHSFIKDSLNITFWNAAAKSFGFIIPIIIAYRFGAGKDTDAFFFAYAIILFISQILSPVIEKVIVPFTAEKKHMAENYSNFVWQVFIFLLLISISATAIAIISANIIIIPFTKFSKEQTALIKKIIILTSPFAIFSILSGLLTGLLNSSKQFFKAAISPAIRSIIIITSIFLLKNKLGIFSILAGYVTGEAMRLLYLYNESRKNKLIKPSLPFKMDKSLAKLFKTAFFHSTSLVFANFHPIVDKTMASWIKESSISILHYAERLYMVPVSFFTTGIMTVFLSYLSDSFYRNRNLSVLKKYIKKISFFLLLISIVLTILLLIVKNNIISLLFGHGSFPKNNIVLLANTWACYLIGLPFYLLSQLLVYAHIVLKNTKSIMICSLITVFLNIIFNFILMKTFGVKGIALSTSIMGIFSSLYLIIKLNNISLLKNDS